MLLIIQYLQLIYITLIFFTFRTKQYRSSISSSAALKRAPILFTTGRHVSSDRLFYFSYNFFSKSRAIVYKASGKFKAAPKNEREETREAGKTLVCRRVAPERKRETPPAFYSQVSRLEFFNPRHFAMVGCARSRETLLSSLQHVRTVFETGFIVCLKYEKVTFKSFSFFFRAANFKQFLFLAVFLFRSLRIALFYKF